MRHLIVLLSLFATVPLAAQWDAGDVYREYIWTTPEGEGEAYLRVGGRYGYAARPALLPDSLQEGDQLLLRGRIDLNDAVRATLTVEKVLSHEDSRDLRVSVNGAPAISIPEPPSIPEPQTEYMYHTDLTVEVPLNQLRDTGNRFRFTLDTNQRWGWPQNLLYALILRVYYPSSPGPSIAYAPGEVPAVSYLRMPLAGGTAQRVDYIFVGEEVDWSGRGIPHRKHWQTYRGKPLHIIGSSEVAAADFAVEWDTEWLPDQDDFGVQARVLLADGRYHVGPVMDGLRLAPRPYSVALYHGEAPKNWVTRSGTFEQRLRVPEDVSAATALRLHWVSWSPCYGNGLFLNGHLLWTRTDDCYVFDTHSPTYAGTAVRYLQEGENVISTALTPLFRGEMVHGMEVQWPGIQLKVRYGGPSNMAGH